MSSSYTRLVRLCARKNSKGFNNRKRKKEKKQSHGVAVFRWYYDVSTFVIKDFSRFAQLRHYYYYYCHIFLVSGDFLYLWSTLCCELKPICIKSGMKNQQSLSVCLSLYIYYMHFRLLHLLVMMQQKCIILCITTVHTHHDWYRDGFQDL